MPFKRLPLTPQEGRGERDERAHYVVVLGVPWCARRRVDSSLGPGRRPVIRVLGVRAPAGGLAEGQQAASAWQGMVPVCAHVDHRHRGALCQLLHLFSSSRNAAHIAARRYRDSGIVRKGCSLAIAIRLDRLRAPR